ncbi:hypothetical protein GCM10010915_22410 [Microbacterium faecale]|uniref:DUF3099 domain-containing protein n=1 Tax=Microbacterium faecale TaxID=1804630 RepID=A0A916YE26_9MICO|nr:DUF3099 domain-containing protein [Microbacterium faecale]GGD41050.1 hypothetical protein GCM10010915_22410 [Microbacterium faecale]
MRKHIRPAQSATSIGKSPQDDETARMKQYVLTMVIRTVCLVLAFAVQPWGWQTAVFSVGAIVLPYIAVVFANQANARGTTTAVSPTRAIEPGAAPADPSEGPHVIRIDGSSEDPSTSAPHTDEESDER